MVLYLFDFKNKFKEKKRKFEIWNCECLSCLLQSILITQENFILYD